MVVIVDFWFRAMGFFGMGLGAPPWPGIPGASEASSGWVYKGKVKHWFCQDITQRGWLPDRRVQEEATQKACQAGVSGSQEPGHPPGAAMDVLPGLTQGSATQTQRVYRLVSEAFKATYITPFSECLPGCTRRPSDPNEDHFPVGWWYA